MRIYEGSGGIAEVKDFPSVFLFEDAEDIQYNKPGMYQKELDVQIEYFHKVSDSNRVYSEGREILEAIQKAVEIDDRFSETCVKYFMSANQVFELRDGVVDVVAVYKFYYVDRFLGYDPIRPFGSNGGN